MGRNFVPKLGEWRDGVLYQFVVTGSDKIPRPDDGEQIVYQRITDHREVLGVCFADGFEQCMASMWAAGYDMGKREGYEQALEDIRRALGL